MKFIIGILLALASTTAFSQHETWKVTEVGSADPEKKGYILHIQSVGYDTKNDKNKIVSGVRLICSTNKNIPDTPIFSLFWNHTSSVSMFSSIDIKVDNNKLPSNQLSGWSHDEKLIYKPVSELKPLIQMMKSGKKLDFEWSGGSYGKHTTSVAIGNFPNALSIFNNRCNTNL